MPENFKKSTNILECEKVNSFHSKYILSQKLVFSKFMFTRPDEDFEVTVYEKNR